MNLEELEFAARFRMARWTLYRPAHEVASREISDGKFWLAYNRTGANYWHANIEAKVFYLLKIEIEERHRRVGLGSELYGIIEQIAWDVGCEEIRQFPSGWTPRGDTRLSYLMRRGWWLEGSEVVKFRKLSKHSARFARLSRQAGCVGGHHSTGCYGVAKANGKGSPTYQPRRNEVRGWNSKSRGLSDLRREDTT